MCNPCFLCVTHAGTAWFRLQHWSPLAGLAAAGVHPPFPTAPNLPRDFGSAGRGKLFFVTVQKETNWHGDS